MPDLVLYDGGCGLCHRSVAFLARRDRDGTRFVFAPLEGETAAARLAEATATPFPAGTVVVLTADARLLLRSSAVLHALGRLGGPWRGLALCLAFVPRPLCDGIYFMVARVRGRLFSRPESTCPRVSANLAGRFLP